MKKIEASKDLVNESSLALQKHFGQKNIPFSEMIQAFATLRSKVARVRKEVEKMKPLSKLFSGII